MSEGWRNRAACADSDKPEIFFCDKNDHYLIHKAKRICKRCPVRLECEGYAIRNDERGIWGGKTEKERKDGLRKIRT